MYRHHPDIEAQAYLYKVGTQKRNPATVPVSWQPTDLIPLQ
jgi:hypothetical protein